MRVDGSAVRMGMVIEYQGKLWLVVKHEIRTPGNLRAFNQVEIRDIITGTKNNIRLSSSESVERVSLSQRDCTFLYAEGDMLTFMDSETFDQFLLPKELLGDSLPFLQDNMTVSVETYEGKPISVQMPEKATLTIVEADPVVKGQTASSSYKPAILENGVRILVPPFIGAGERVVVNIADAAYVERAKKEG
ncbi:MAG: elongation factor P [Alphaproteobacteria bacterium]|nr:elongation factor P [Alphaproteobacteria bacterium]